jgi:hypothetical protein
VVMVMSRGVRCEKMRIGDRGSRLGWGEGLACVEGSLGEEGLFCVDIWREGMYKIFDWARLSCVDWGLRGWDGKRRREGGQESTHVDMHHVFCILVYVYPISSIPCTIQCR